jgi:hypothetical protein
MALANGYIHWFSYGCVLRHTAACINSVLCRMLHKIQGTGQAVLQVENQVHKVVSGVDVVFPRVNVGKEVGNIIHKRPKRDN